MRSPMVSKESGLGFGVDTQHSEETTHRITDISISEIWLHKFEKGYKQPLKQWPTLLRIAKQQFGHECPMAYELQPCKAVGANKPTKTFSSNDIYSDGHHHYFEVVRTIFNERKLLKEQTRSCVMMMI